MQVFVEERKSDFSYGLVNSAYTKHIHFTEDENATKEEIENAPTELVFVLDEE